MISNPLSVLSFLVSEGLSLRGAAEAIPVFCRGRSVHGLTSPSPRIDLPLRADRGVLCRGNPCFCRGRSVHGLTSPSPRIDLPLQKQGIGLARRGRSVHGLTSPSPRIDLPLQKQGVGSAQNARSARRGRAPRCMPGCRGEAELSKTRSQGFCLAPTAWYAARCKCRHPPCHCEAQPK